MSSPSTLPRTWVEIDFDALRHNASIARQASSCEVMAIVKANAYGHGAVPVARALSGLAAAFGVANLNEAEELRAGGVTEPILLLSPCLPEEQPLAVQRGFHLCVSTLEEARVLEALAAKFGTKAHVHVTVDTGMGRMGFLETVWTADTIRALLSLRHLVWEGLASHLPSADEDANFTRAQIARFLQCVETAHAAGLAPRWVHLLNSAGLLGYTAETRGLCRLARPGLMLFGVSPLPERQGLLRQVMTWKTRITLIRELPAGHGISYGRTDILRRATQVATVACGYADGYPRQVSGKGAHMLIGGKRCPLLGRVTMDQMMVDVTDLEKPARVGDEVVLMGTQGAENICAAELAQQAATIPWHIFTGLTARVERRYGSPRNQDGVAPAELEPRECHLS